MQHKRRYDLIPNLVETVKGYAAQEQDTLEKVIQARNMAINAKGVTEQAEAENMLSSYGLDRLPKFLDLHSTARNLRSFSSKKVEFLNSS